ncbi:MAG: family 43 glycosylhydrolase [Treponema sp.]|nr:family 43 glycosylhydrolase [Treponema sp.]
MKKQIFNPYMPSWEYVPDGEPHVFGDRVYVYGSHDLYNGSVFCLGDYVCYSAPVEDLKDWRCEGVIYRKNQDPAQDGRMVLYAPDVTRGPDGRYYLYYVFDKVNFVSVAVCDTPAGKYEFYGYVHYKDGTRLGEKEGNMPQFDPAVLTEGDKTYLYTGFCGNKMKDRLGAMATVLGPDMLTIEEDYNVIVPGDCYGENTGFVNHEFFEAPSIRKIGDTYYFVYSSAVMHELCYATSKCATKDFVYGGVIVSNCDLGIDSYKPAEMPAAYGANNHGGFELINGEYYIFYHRHTNGTWYSRQGCAEKIKVLADGSIPQVEITSCGLNGGPLEGKGEYAAYIACNLFNNDNPRKYVGGEDAAKIVQDGRDGDEERGFTEPGYIVNIRNNTTIGFKYFEFKDLKKITITTRAYFYGKYEVRTKWDGPVVAEIDTLSSNFWEDYSAAISIPDGVHALYLTFKGTGVGELKSVRFE